MENNHKKNVLVLSGGGFLGAYEVGAINYLNQNWTQITGKQGEMKFDIVAGVSVGSLNGVLVAQNKLELLNDLWDGIIRNGHDEIFTSEYINPDGSLNLNFEAFQKDLFPNFKISVALVLKGIINSFGRIFSKKIPSFMTLVINRLKRDLETHLPYFLALADNTPLRNKLTKIVSLSDFSPQTKYLCGFVSLNDGEYYSVQNNEFKSNTDLINGILASTAMPIVWPAVSNSAFADKNPVNLIDGGLRNISPLGNVVNLINQDKDDAEYNIFVINCHGNTIEYKDIQKWNLIQNAARALHDITLSEIFRNDIEKFILQNKIMKEFSEKETKLKFTENERKYTVHKKYELHIIQPEKEGILGNSLDTRAESILKRKQKGEFDAQQYFSEKIKNV